MQGLQHQIGGAIRQAIKNDLCGGVRRPLFWSNWLRHLRKVQIQRSNDRQVYGLGGECGTLAVE
ncbi:hypothetical protein D3C75_1141220 [compost metagenome]